MRDFLKGMVALASVALLAGCMTPPPPPSGNQVSYNTNVKIEAVGLVLPDPVTGRPMFVLGSFGYDSGSTPAVYSDGADSTSPLQASYIERTLPDGTVQLEIRDGTTNCTGFDLATSAEAVDVSAGIFKTFCMGLGAQDLAIGLADGQQ